jgi:hypothetical protein
MRCGTSGSSRNSASSARIFALVPVSARRRSSASTALRSACSIRRRRSPRWGTEISTLPPALPAGLGQQFGLGQGAVDEDQARRRHFLVELGEEAGHHLGLFQALRCGGEEGAVAPVLPAANEEGLDGDLPALGAMAKTSALPTPSALIAWLPWMKVAARRRSRSMAARSKSSASAAALICVSISRCTAPDLPPRKSFAWRTSSP